MSDGKATLPAHDVERDEQIGKKLSDAKARDWPLKQNVNCPDCGRESATVWRDGPRRTYSCVECFAGTDGDERPTWRPPGVHAVSVGEFLDTTYPEPEELIPGVLAAGAHTLIHADRGLGKSNFGLGLSIGLASGSSPIPRFEVKRPASVLYLDGELTPALIQERLRVHLSTVGAEPDEIEDRLRIISRIAIQAESGERIPSLATPRGRTWLLGELEEFKAEVIVVDTVRALMRHPTHSLSDEEGWRPCEELLAELSALHRSVLYLHHDGKSGDQLGTSAREFDPSYVIHLTKPERSGSGFCRFVMRETKGRMGPTFQPRELVLEPNHTGPGYSWTIVEERERTKAEKILDLRAQHPEQTSTYIAELAETTSAHVRSVLSKARKADE